VGTRGGKWWAVPLTGTYLRTLDDKRRLAVPKRLRDDFGEANLQHLFIAPGTDRSLVLYAPNGFGLLAQRLSDKASHQNYLRMFYASAERVDLDGQGRIRIPDRLAEYAHLERDAYLLGVQDHAELWDKRSWDEFSSRLNADFDQLAHNAFQIS
jgi:MraZ protein